VHVTCPECGEEARRETDVSDTFVDSAWYFLRYPSTDADDRPWDTVMPVDFYAGGPEHVQRHHLYARFVTMALHDLGLVPFAEPFPHIRLGGIIVHGGAKMSKSRGNVVNPDDYFDRGGGDVLRCALLFSAPWDEGGEFQDNAIAGVERFFARAWRFVDAADRADDEGFVLDRLVADVGHAVERLRFNVAIARLMEALPRIGSAASQRVFVRLLAPLAPYLAEELWHRLGEESSVHAQPWPDYDAAKLRAATVTLAVQVDGKTRARIDVPAGTSEDDARTAALADARIAATLGAGDVRRVVYVPDRVINLVR
jgi:leucyl-tRNA synthetase